MCIIGTDVQENLFPGVDPIGQELRADGVPYTVIGVVEKQGSTFGQSQDNWIGGAADDVPEGVWDGEDGDDLYQGGAAGAPLERAADEVRVLMRARGMTGRGPDRRLSWIRTIRWWGLRAS